MPGKLCGSCEGPYAGFGTTCGMCRKGGKAAPAQSAPSGAGCPSSKCAVCEKTAYLNERVQVEGMFLHTACFQCHHCSRKLGLGSFSRTKEGDFYCKVHYEQLFKRRGRYSFAAKSAAPEGDAAAPAAEAPELPPVCEDGAAEDRDVRPAPGSPLACRTNLASPRAASPGVERSPVKKSAAMLECMRTLSPVKKLAASFERPVDPTTPPSTRKPSPRKPSPAASSPSPRARSPLNVPADIKATAPQSARKTLMDEVRQVCSPVRQRARSPEGIAGRAEALAASLTASPPAASPSRNAAVEEAMLVCSPRRLRSASPLLGPLLRGASPAGAGPSLRAASPAGPGPALQSTASPATPRADGASPPRGRDMNLSPSRERRESPAAASKPQAAPGGAGGWTGDGAPLEDSNCANIGGEEDKAARKGAAEKEPAWEGVGLEPGLWVWRVEAFQVVEWPREHYGKFHEGDSYIVLHVEGGDDEPLEREIYFWLGQSSSTDERGTAAYKTVELDDYFDGSCGQNREVMQRESHEFHSIFPNIQYLEGGVESGFNPAQPEVFHTQLLHLRKTKKDGIVTSEVALTAKSMNHRDCFVLDNGTAVYTWYGENASPFIKAACISTAHNIADDRNGQAQLIVEPGAEFWGLLGGSSEADVLPADKAPDTDTQEPPDFGNGILYKVMLDEQRQLKVEQVGRRELDRSMLDTASVMMLDTRSELFLWLGTQAGDTLKRQAMPTAIQYLKVNGRPVDDTAIHVFKEGQGVRNKYWASIFPRVEPVRSGAVGTGRVGSGPVFTGPVQSGPEPVRSGAVGTGRVGSGPVSTGPVRCSPIFTGPVRSSPVFTGPVQVK